MLILSLPFSFLYYPPDSVKISEEELISCICARMQKNGNGNCLIGRLSCNSINLENKELNIVYMPYEYESDYDYKEIYPDFTINKYNFDGKQGLVERAFAVYRKLSEK